MKMQKQKKGFTLIELLIVIALLGTLAVALLAAIDPFEQFRKGTDTAIRNTAQEYYNALIRFYAQRSAFPTDFPQITPDGLGYPLTTTSFVTGVIEAGELKSNFLEIAQDQLANIYVARAGVSKLLVCFQPQSKSFQKADKNTKYSSYNFTSSSDDATVNTDSATCSATNSCYWCVY
ncbi:MAG: prepilin-type N-terminal cleavage/methylation domain-containing protein [Candidatus Roizmanbacteria bacterium]|nr:prepilin-type N-terminal cleavage/methylation domain-containing protein [Candidatus Roizmanbacteria bacterium]